MLESHDLAATVKFYTDTLGFTCDAYEEGWGWASLSLDKVAIMFANPNPHRNLVCCNRLLNAVFVAGSGSTGNVALIEATPTGYNLKGKFAPDYQKGASWAHPVIVNGKLYLREQDKLMCYQVGK